MDLLLGMLLGEMLLFERKLTGWKTFEGKKLSDRFAFLEYNDVGIKGVMRKYIGCFFICAFNSMESMPVSLETNIS